jgi:uncharacterized protein (DUF885 family)
MPNTPNLFEFCKITLTTTCFICLIACGDDLTFSTLPSSAEPVSNKAKTLIETETSETDKRFSKLSAELLEEFWEVFPDYARWAGQEGYESRLSIPNEKQRQAENNFSLYWLDKLQTVPLTELNVLNIIDHHLLEDFLKRTLWENQEFLSWQWNPSQYNVAEGFASIMNSRFKSADEKHMMVLERLTAVPTYYKAAQEALTSNPMLPFTELGIQQNKGALSVLSDELLHSLEQTNLSDKDKALFARRLDDAQKAIQAYINFLTDLKTKLLGDNSARSFRIGAEHFEEKFAFDIQSTFTARQLYDLALEDQAEVTARMIKITTQLWPKYFPRTPLPKDNLKAIKQLIDHLAGTHVDRENFLSAIQQHIPQLESFIKEKQLFTLDAEKPLVVRREPDYMSGFAGASISAPGPLEANENTYYNVSTFEHLSEEEAESTLREYNQWILQILNIHEAIPGHYTQLLYSNLSPSLVKSIFGNGAMIEGWAVYSERMMLEEGYGNQEPELWLMWYKWNLRVICNIILDYSVHVLDMKEEQAMDLLINQAFQEPAEAAGKWRRATLSQVQLSSYYSGYREIYNFREEQRDQLGAYFSLRDFHHSFLSYGSSPVKYIKEAMTTHARLE